MMNIKTMGAARKNQKLALTKTYAHGNSKERDFFWVIGW